MAEEGANPWGLSASGSMKNAKNAKAEWVWSPSKLSPANPLYPPGHGPLESDIGDWCEARARDRKNRDNHFEPYNLRPREQVNHKRPTSLNFFTPMTITQSVRHSSQATIPEAPIEKLRQVSIQALNILQELYSVQREHDNHWNSTILASRNVNYDKVIQWVQNLDKPKQTSVNQHQAGASQPLHCQEVGDIIFKLQQLGNYQVAQLKQEIKRIRCNKCSTDVGGEFTIMVAEHGILCWGCLLVQKSEHEKRADKAKKEELAQKMNKVFRPMHCVELRPRRCDEEAPPR
ncbi:hypothetical protein QBC34DRAFT_423149 [Podospora aff. communis PSN243]|uniref:Uncharacterized protein n=1 Tax=Podospora aff. communis PSN243 TaxID=3040156 RepID=A0AAV9GTF8_9PEZI|nr:hypothetical protein QBC34DRAFT_423149 [Podospora aff. communis PSN243]